MNRRSINQYFRNTLQTTAVLFALLFFTGAAAQLPLLKISPDRRSFSTREGKPFFWLGDTGWLLFVKCTRENALLYLDTRKEQGFNVVQAMLLHDFNNTRNVYGDWALNDFDVSRPAITPGADFSEAAQYDYWDHVDFIIDEAAKRGIYMAIVPTWGSNVKSGKINEKQAEAYARFLAKRYRNRSNIIWLNGGDINGKDGLAVWQKIGSTLRKNDTRHLITFHPRGRTSSTDWFHRAAWLDFNMFQSGHKSYSQDTSSKERRHFGEDNWRYVQEDYAMKPVKPTLDGEPSYEDIPYGLHDTLHGYWRAADIRRYAYWSVLAGGAGFTYGHNAVMQYYMPGDTGISFFPQQDWKKGLHAEGANQMKYLKKLIENNYYYNLVPAPELVADNGTRYDYIAAAKGRDYALFYTWNGQPIRINTSLMPEGMYDIYWYDPRTGNQREVGIHLSLSDLPYDPPGEKVNGNDWLLLVRTTQKGKY